MDTTSPGSASVIAHRQVDSSSAWSPGDSGAVRVAVSAALGPGAELGTRFRIEALIGEGGMGRVYKAYDKELGRVVALKVLQPELTTDGRATARFKQELLLASRISHKNVLRIHDLSEAGGVKFISMAFIEGQDLHELLKKEHPLPLDRVLKIARQLCEALDAAHAEGVVHRDFKPQNVLIGKDDQVFVSDFGLAKSLEAGVVGMTRTGAYMGTPRYMSPEQAQGRPVDGRSDLYALGLVLYEMVTGDVPFAGDSVMQVMYARVKEKPKNPKSLNPALPDWFARVILRCLERDPANRYQSAREILADLDAARSPSLARSVQITVPVFENRWWYAVPGALLLLIVIILVVPGLRHFVFRAGGKGSAVTESGLPPLSKGKFIAVLPFRVMGDPGSLDYVADGLDEALSAKLFQFKDVRMASTTSAARVDQKAPLQQIAKDLGVNLIVHGLIQSSGKELRITVILDDLAGGKLYWTQEFSGMTGDLLTLEDQIYAGLVQALQERPTSGELAAAASHPTENVEAYDLYLRGRNALRNQQDQKSVQAAIGFFDQALKKDSSFTLAYAGMADASLVMYRETKDTFWSQKALGAAQQAQGLNDALPEAHLSLGSVYNATGKTAEAIAQLQRALQLAPNSDEAYRRLGGAYMASGRKDDGIAAYKKAAEVNPYYWVNQNSIGLAYDQLGQYDDALAAFKRVEELEPNNVFAYLNTGAVYLAQGKYEESIPAFQKALSIPPPRFDVYSNLGTANFYLKRYPEAVQMFEKAADMNPNQEMVIGNLADAYRWSGQKDKAQATYDKAIALALKELSVNPRQSSAMGSLALYYAKKGDNVQALRFIHQARAIDSAGVNLTYIQAVVENLDGQTAAAVATLRSAFEKGYQVKDAQDDPELDNLHSRADYQKLIQDFNSKKN